MKSLKYIQTWIGTTSRNAVRFIVAWKRGLEYLEKSNKEIFMEDYGFCHDCSQLCPVIPPKEAMYTEDVDKFYQNKNQEVATSIKFGCIECKMKIQEQMILALGKIVSIILPIQN